MSFERFDGGTAGWKASSAAMCTPVADRSDQRVTQAQAAIARMEQTNRPDQLTERQWHVLLKDVRYFADQWLDIALTCGWTLRDLFGSPVLGTTRLDLVGVALALKGRHIQSIDPDRIVITNRVGPANVFYRQSPGCSAPFARDQARLIWEAVWDPR